MKANIRPSLCRRQSIREKGPLLLAVRVTRTMARVKQVIKYRVKKTASSSEKKQCQVCRGTGKVAK